MKLSEIKCESFDVLNSKVKCTDSNMYKSICKTVCNNGYYLKSSKTDKIMCELNGLWNKNIPVCLPNPCPKETVEEVL